MKKTLLITIVLLVSIVKLGFAQNINIDGKSYSVDTLSYFKAGPGTYYSSLRLQSNNRLDVFFLHVDLTLPHVQLKAALGRDSIYTGERPSELAKRKSKEGEVYFAGTNADFYVTQGYVGYPVGGTIVNSELATIPNSRRIFSIDDQKIPHIGVMSYAGNIITATETWTINTVNHLRNENQMVLYNQHNGKVTRTNAFGTEVLVELLPNQTWGSNKNIRVKVIKIETNKGSMAIPKNQAVLSGHGTAAAKLNTLKVNDELDINFALSVNGIQNNFMQMVGGDNRLPMLWNGVVEANINNIWNELHPRTGIGFSQDKTKIIFCVVDGRGASAGVTTKQLAELMQWAGAHTAFNMDGGGSSAMYVKEFGPMNTTSDGSERAVANAIYAVSTSPTDNNVAEIMSYEATLKLPPYGIFKPRFLAYNQYGMLLNKDLQDVQLSCDPAIGHINSDGFFVAAPNGNGVLNANYNGIQTQIKIKIVQEAEIAIRLDSVVVDNFKHYAIEVQSKIGLNTMQIQPNALTWTVEDPAICDVQNGIVNALSNGRTRVFGQLGNFKDTVVVIVETPTHRNLVQDNFSNTSNWQLTASLSSWNASLNNNELPANWQHGARINYIFKTTRAPFIKLTQPLRIYGLPDSVKIVVNTQSAKFNNIIVGMRTANSNTTAVNFTNIAQNTDVELKFPISQFVSNTADRLSYPLRFEYMTLFLDAAGHVQDKEYNIFVKDISLTYNNITSSVINNCIKSGFVIYPNPANSDEIFVSSKSFLEPSATINVYNTAGQLLQSKKRIDSVEQQSMDISSLPKGNYILQIQHNKGYESQKFSKQ